MEPIAPVASATASRLSALGGNTLTEGQLMLARVVRVDGNQVRLQFGEQSLNASSRVPLTVGQQVNLLVEQGASGKMLLRMVDDTFGKGWQARGTESGAGSSQNGGTSATAAGSRQGPIIPVPGRSGQGPFDSQQQSSGQGGAGNFGSGPGTNPGRLSVGLPSQGQPGGGAAPNIGAGPTQRGGFVAGGPGIGQTTGQSGQAGQQIGLPWMPGTLNAPSVAASASALAALLFAPLDGAPIRKAGGAAPSQQAPGQAGSKATSSTGTPGTGSAGGPQAAPARPGGNQTVADGATGLIAKSALPTYGRLAQSVGGAVAFGQLLATHTPEINQTLARASLAPTDLGRLLVNLGVHPDEMNAVLVEMLAQGEAVQEGNIRGLRRALAAAGGSLRDAAPAVALARLGLPITPLSLAVARQLQAGQLVPGAAWGDLLKTLQQLTQGPMSGSQAGVLAAELLADWRVPLEEGAPGIAKWLQTAIDQAGTPLEAKLARPLMGDGTTHPAHASPGQDVRARLDLLAQALPNQARGARGELASTLSASIHRVQATVQGEQLLNGSMAAPSERTEPRFFAVTMPTVMGQQLSTLELRVKERDARPASRPGELARPDVVQLKLNLPGLGDLSVNLTVGQHSVACQFATSTQFAEALLTASSSELVGRLKRLGYGHTTVEAAHEPPAPAQPALTRGPRLHQVDLRE